MKPILDVACGSKMFYWKHFIKQGFVECMRVLKPNGTLIMKWSSNQIQAKDVLKAIGVKPILGTRKSKKNYWWVFMKGGN